MKTITNISKRLNVINDVKWNDALAFTGANLFLGNDIGEGLSQNGGTKM